MANELKPLSHYLSTVVEFFNL